MELKNKRGIGLIALIVIIVAILIIGGIIIGIVIINKNKNKEPITLDEFKYKMEEMGYIVVDVSDQADLYEFIQNAYLVADKDNKYKIEFYKVDKAENAVFLYNKNKNNIELYKGSNSFETSVEIGNNAKYTLTTENEYRLISRIDDTFVYACGNKEYKDELQEILKKIGY